MLLDSPWPDLQNPENMKGKELSKAYKRNGPNDQGPLYVPEVEAEGVNR